MVGYHAWLKIIVANKISHFPKLIIESLLTSHKSGASRIKPFYNLI